MRLANQGWISVAIPTSQPTHQVTANRAMVQKESRVLNIYRRVVIGLGAAVLLFSCWRLDLAELSPGFLLYSILTIAVASRVGVNIPGVKGFISVSDTFIFLAILIYGGEAGILLATADAVIPSYKLAKTKTTLIFNIAVFAVSTFATVWIPRLVLGMPHGPPSGVITSDYMITVCLMGFIQYAFNSGLIAAAAALRSGQTIWQMWRDHFLWTSLTYLAGSTAAGIIAVLVGVFGTYAFLAAMPIAGVLYFTYTTYLKNVASAAKQAELAQKHVEELSHHIAEQERISRALRESEAYFRTAFDSAAGMAVVDPDGRWRQVNQSLCRMLGYTEAELLKNGFQAITHPSDLGNDIINLRRLLEGDVPTYQLEKRYCHKDGFTLWVLQSASLIRDADGEPMHVIFQIQDISDRKKAEEQIHHAAFHDALTGLPNRLLFTDRLSRAVKRSKRSLSYKFAVVFVDLDRFKIVNDSLGHDRGDKLLVDLSRRLEKCVRPFDIVARLGGDEFAILLDDVGSIHDATDVAERIQTLLKEPFDLDGHEFCTSASLGISCSWHGFERAEDILRNADTAMYKAKANGKARHEVFDHAMHTRAIEALTLENELRRAIERDEVKPYYQPVVSLRTGEIVGFEALARWVHPQRGLISPADFIPLAEETGLIVPVGYSILKEACRQTAIWQLAFDRPGFSVSVNLSVKQFTDEAFESEIKKILSETGLDPKTLKLEITESIVMDNNAAIATIKRLKALGIQISIDDFGTGYSSLSYLHRFPFDVIKIDRTFTSRMATDRESLSIVKTITALALELGKSVIAEGVEEEEHQRILSEIGCQYGQGYLYSKPIDSASANALLSVNLGCRDLEVASYGEVVLGSDVIQGIYEM
jgi:diguanylate cyclase (GGDEF)-like protein/PAS domain S-box-containing protein